MSRVLLLFLVVLLLLLLLLFMILDPHLFFLFFFFFFLFSTTHTITSGLLLTLSHAIDRFPDAHRTLMEENDMISTLISHYLFKIATKVDSSESVCHTTLARRAAFRLLVSISKCDRSAGEQIFLHMKEFDDSVDHWSENLKAMRHDVEGWKKDDSGYCGLTNQGNTCYLNATVQQIFMIQNLRRGLLSFHVPVTLLEESKVGGGGGGGGGNTASPDKMETMRQLQRSMCFLSEGTFAGYNPKLLVDSCLNLGMSENIYDQNCAAEFVMKLLDRLEETTKGTMHEKLMKFHFSGSFAHLTSRYSDEDVVVPPEHLLSRRTEAFQILPLNIVEMGGRKHSTVESFLFFSLLTERVASQLCM